MLPRDDPRRRDFRSTEVCPRQTPARPGRAICRWKFPPDATGKRRRGTGRSWVGRRWGNGSNRDDAVGRPDRRGRHLGNRRRARTNAGWRIRRGCDGWFCEPCPSRTLRRCRERERCGREGSRVFNKSDRGNGKGKNRETSDSVISSLLTAGTCPEAEPCPSVREGHQ